MATLNTEFVHRCIHTLGLANAALSQHRADSDLVDIYRAACVKEFEIISEQCAKLLKKSLLVPQFLTDTNSFCKR